MKIIEVQSFWSITFVLPVVVFVADVVVFKAINSQEWTSSVSQVFYSRPAVKVITTNGMTIAVARRRIRISPRRIFQTGLLVAGDRDKTSIKDQKKKLITTMWQELWASDQV